MKLTSDNGKLAENKVLILYILDNVKEPITNNGLYQIILAVIDMNYFYFQQFLLDLIENDFVMQYDSDEHTVYQITERGKETLSLTEDLLPGIMKLKVDTNLKSTMEKVSEEDSIVAEYMPRDENYYNVTCKIVESNECIFEIKTFAGSREQAKQIVDNWKNNATKIYPKLLETLTANYDSFGPTEQPLEEKQQEEDNSPVEGNINLFDM